MTAVTLPAAFRSGEVWRGRERVVYNIFWALVLVWADCGIVPPSFCKAALKLTSSNFNLLLPAPHRTRQTDIRVILDKFHFHGMTTPPSGNPLGPLVPPSAVEIPKQIYATLPGRLVTLVPGDASHLDDLFEVLGGEENAVLWDYLPCGPFPNIEELRAFFSAHWQNPDEVFFTIISNATQKAVGSLALINIDRDNRKIQISFTLFSKQLQKTTAATEAMYLLAAHAFDNLGVRRYEGKSDNLNGPIQRAALRLGFKFEGVSRQHMIVKGRNRDTAWFSILDGEWPTVKKGLESWLDAENFDQEGRQRKSLTALRDAV